MTESLKICAIGIVFAIICVLVKTYRSEFAITTRLAGIIVIFGGIIFFLSPIVEYLKKLMGQALSLEYMEIILKTLAIAYMTQLSSELCRDCGENNIASGIEIAGKIEIIILSLPLIDKIISLSEELLSW